MNSQTRPMTPAAPVLPPPAPAAANDNTPSAPVSLVRAEARRARFEPWLVHVPETQGRFQLRGVTGVIFILFGMMKLFDTTLPILVGAPGLHVPTGVEGFAQLLAGLGVPFPLFNAWFVIAVEVLCGLGLILGARLPATRLLTRLCALPLAVDMVVALSVGVRQVTGNPVVLQGLPVMNQFWRLPLEVSLLVGMVYLLCRPVAHRRTSRPVPVPVPAGVQ